MLRGFSLLMTCALLLVAVPASGGWVSVAPHTDGEPLRWEVFSSAGETVLDVWVSAVLLGREEIGGRWYDTVSLDKGIYAEPGLPEVPAFAVRMAVPRGAPVQLEVQEVETVELPELHLPPHQFGRKRGMGLLPRLFDRRRSLGDSVFPGRAAWIEERGEYAGVDTVLLRVAPVRTIASSDRSFVHPHLRIRVLHSPGGSVLPARISVLQHQLLSALFANGPALLQSELPEVVRDRLLVIAPGAYHAALDPLSSWKSQMGYEVSLVAIEEVGSSAADLLAYLQELYDNPDSRPSYVLLVGDIAEMPTLHGIGSCASDFLFSTLQGNDLVSDLVVSRLSVASEQDVAVQVSKILRYERDAMDEPGEDWLRGGLCISSSEGDGASNDDVRTGVLASLLSDGGFHPVDVLLHSLGNDTAEAVIELVEAGKGLVTYLGHGSGTAWATTTPNYAVAHIEALDNAGKTPVVMDVSCSNGAFDVLETCFAEAWMRANQAGIGTGAVAIYSSSTEAAWDEPAEMAVGLVEQLTQGSLYRWGDLCLAAREKMVGVFGATETVTEVCQQYIVFGDGSMGVRSRRPSALVVEAPLVVPLGAAMQTIRVTDAPGTPVVGAWVHLWKGDELDAFNLTDAAGNAAMWLAPETPGTVQMVVTARDAAAYFGSTEVVVGGCGTLLFPTAVLPCDGAMKVSLWDTDLNLDPGSQESGLLQVSGGDVGGSTLVAVEVGVDSSLFEAWLEVGSLVANPEDGQQFVVSYSDGDCEGVAVEVQDTVTLDCTAPGLSNLEVVGVTATGLRVQFETDEPAQAWVHFGQAGSWWAMQTVGPQSHIADLKSLTPSTTCQYWVEATDAAGNSTVDDNAGGFYEVTTLDCSPDCAGKQCGSDGCGGSCGDCLADQTCLSSGACFGGAGCLESDSAGCGNCKCESCVCQADSYCCEFAWDGQCVWECTDLCGGCGPCVPDCFGKVCGDDGCGGSCGICGAMTPFCSGGTCSALCAPDCGGKLCGADGCGGSCGTCPEAFLCESGACVPDYAHCAAKNVAGCEGCACESCVCAKDPFCCETQWDGQCADQCIYECGGCGVCTADCSGRECGSDGCGGSCGDCDATENETCGPYGLCVCAPLSCEQGGWACGDWDDGCGGTVSCPPCAAGFSCTQGVCLGCQPDCEGKRCGSDGCGGDCGDCDSFPNSYCTPDFDCGCKPSDCESLGAECGRFDDGCGAELSCPTCGRGQRCEDGVCVDCEPDCANRQCGDDNCGGTCGDCQEGWMCLASGQCTMKVVDITQMEDFVEDEAPGENAGGSCSSSDSGMNHSSQVLLVLMFALLAVSSWLSPRRRPLSRRSVNAERR